MKSEANVKNTAVLEAVNARERNRAGGSIGSRARRSQPTNAATSSAPAVSEATTSRLPQPAALPRTRPQTMPSAPAVISASPGMSRAVSGPRDSSIRVSTSGIVARPIGTLSQKIHSQARPSTTAPPTSGPSATDTPVTALKMPIAAPRFSGGNAALSSASPSGSTSAAPTPCAARAAISQPTPGASAHRTDAAVNTPMPTA